MHAGSVWYVWCMVYGVWSVQINFVTTEHCRYGSMEDRGVSNAEYLAKFI